MAKSIKAIKCPQCGSTKQKKLDDEHFQCLNCGSEYILDSDDININHTYNYSNTSVPTVSKKAALIVLLIVIGMPLFIMLLTSIFSSDKSTGEKLLSQKYYWDNNAVSQGFTDADGNFKLFIWGTIKEGKQRGYTDKPDSPLYWGIYNVATDQLHKLHTVSSLSMVTTSTAADHKIKMFDDGKIYIIFKKSQLFVYEPVNNTLVYLNPELEQNNKKLSNGIASIDFEYNYFGIRVISNTGSQFSYFPSAKLEIDNLAYYMQQSRLYPKQQEQTHYAVSNSNPNYLIRYKNWGRSGYPVLIQPDFSVRLNADYQPKKASISTSDSMALQLVDYQILNKERKTYKLSLIGYSSQNIAIAFKENIQEGEKYKVQYLNTSGHIQWTCKTPHEQIADGKGILSVTQGVLYATPLNYSWIDASGTLKKTFSLYDIAFDVK